MLFVRSDQESCSCKSPNLFKFLLGLCMSQQGEQSRIHLGTWEIRKIPEDVGLMQRCRKILMAVLCRWPRRCLVGVLMRGTKRRVT